MKTKTPSTEPLFDIKMTVKATHLGAIIAFLDKKTEAFDVHLVKEVSSAKNLPRGAYKETIFELLKSGGMPIGDLKKALREAGFTNSTVHSGITKMIVDKTLIKNRNGIIRKAK